MAFGRKVHAFASMFRQRKIAEADSELEALTKDLFGAEQERNQLLHSAWNYSEALSGDFMRMKASAKAKQGLRRRFHRMPPERIEKTRDRIGAAGQSLMSFTIKYIQGRKVPPNIEAAPR